jgi:hypothetical protein
MAIDPSLVTVAPYESERVISDGLDIGELEVTPLHELDGPPVPLALRTRTEAAQLLMRVDTAVPVGPVDFHHTGPARRAQLDWLGRVTHEVRRSHLPDAATVRSRTPTVA